MDVERWKTWKKRNPDFPLTVSGNGQWCKRISGRRHYFGPLDDYKGAAERYFQAREYLAAGIDPPDWLAPGEMSFRGIMLKHRKHVERQVARGERSRHTLEDYRTVDRVIGKHPILDKRVDAITPSDWLSLRGYLQDRQWSLRTLRNVMLAVRSVVQWGARMELCEPPRFGAGFDAPTPAQIERQTVRKDRFITSEQIGNILSAASPRMKAATLLAINCGFTSNDLAQIKASDIHLRGNVYYHDFPRPKTGQRRMMVLLPKTATAVLGLGQAGNIFPNKYGRPFRGQSINSAILREFSKLSGLPKGVNIGSLRHTFGTLIGESHDEEIKALAMGHTQKSLRARVYSQHIVDELDRLSALADIIADFLGES